jgi:hypothetical protein
LLYKTLGKFREGRRKKQATRATIGTQITLSQVTKHFRSLDLILELREDLRL